MGSEMKGGERSQKQMTNFREVLDVCGLENLGAMGYEFTFDNGQPDERNRQSRLDRVVGNVKWKELYPSAKLINLDREWSDHAPIKLLLESGERGGGKRARLFRFEHVWVDEEGCEEVVREARRAGGRAGGRGVAQKIHNCAMELGKCNGSGEVIRELQRKRRRLKKLNEGRKTEERVRERKRMIADIARLRLQEERYLRQRSRVLWLREGDRNTTFFHKKATQRKQRNMITELVGDGGQVHRGDEAVEGVILGYFSTLFQSSRSGDMEDALEGIQGRVTEAQNEGLRAEYMGAEVAEALEQMHPLKAPGPDGMNALFYQTYWHIIGLAVVELVLGCLGEEGCRRI